MSDLFELSVTRRIDAPVEKVWRIWTERLAEWWAPQPWTTELIAFDLTAGGAFSAVMHGPDGESSAIEGVLLEVVPERRIVFTNALTAGWVPQKPFIVGIFTFAEEDGGTRYTAAARHWDEATMQQHESMGFHEGWGAVTGQLAGLAEMPERSAALP